MRSGWLRWAFGGGQLALCLAAREAGVKAVLSLAGVVNLQRAYELHLSNDAWWSFWEGHRRRWEIIIGSGSDEAGDRGAQWLVHGAEDDVVPVAFSQNYVQAKVKTKEDARLVEIAGAGHFEVVDPRAEAGRKWSRSL